MTESTPDVVTESLDLLDPALATARTAWAAIDSHREVVPTPLPQGELPVTVAAAACALDAAVHAWDIAAAPARAPQPADGHAADGHAAELLRYLGRDPQWQA